VTEISRADIQWHVLERAMPCLARIRATMTPQDYDRDKVALQEFLCGYFRAGSCRHRQGRSIAPLKSSTTEAGGKCLKVRWATPGSGKSGGLRLAIVVYCDRKLVKVAGAWQRAQDPSDDEFFAAARDG
jgi:hypothetical protein